MLNVESVSVRYGGVRAVDDVSIRVDSGEVVGLLGANGAGKTTLIDAISGFAPSTGRVTLDGEPLDECRAHVRAKYGLARTWQQADLFDDISVRDNLRIAVDTVTWRSMVLDALRPRRHSIVRIVEDVIVQLGLADVAHLSPNELSQGARKLVGVGRALVRQPKALLLDEPAAGLSTSESKDLGRSITAVAREGVAVLLIEHDVNLVLSVSDRVYALESGRVIAEGTPGEIRTHPEVITSYLGSGRQSEGTNPQGSSSARSHASHTQFHAMTVEEQR